MPELWFYHLDSMGVEEALPPLLERCLQRGWRALVRTTLPERAEALGFHDFGKPGDRVQRAAEIVHQPRQQLALVGQTTLRAVEIAHKVGIAWLRRGIGIAHRPDP